VLLFLFLVVFLAVSYFEFPTERFLVSCAKETLINEWDAWGTESSEMVHSLCWASQEEESWRKFRITVEEYQWVVSFKSMSGLLEAPFSCGFLAPYRGWLVVDIWNNNYMVGWNVLPKQLVSQMFLKIYLCLSIFWVILWVIWLCILSCVWEWFYVLL